MSLTIRERCGKVAECLNKKGVATIQSIALATGLSKSSVHRHKQAIAQRNHYSESEFWETQTGSEWLKLMVLGVVYYFGVKEGIGCERLSEFLESVRQSIDIINLELQIQEQAQQQYNQSLHSITLAVHPFDIDTQEWQLSSTLSSCLNAPMTVLSTLALTYGTDKASAAIDTFRTQIPFLAQGIHAWWQWVTQALATLTDVIEIQDWVLCSLLPWFYWQQQADKTRHPELKQRYLQAESQAHLLFNEHPLTQQMDQGQLQHWFVWAQWICSKYQRTSSAIVGRNGCLSRLHHTSRGFSPQTLQVLTIIHNFDTRRADGTTPAQRLFHQTFPYLFEWVVDDLGDLPLPRKSSKSHYS